MVAFHMTFMVNLMGYSLTAAKRAPGMDLAVRPAGSGARGALLKFLSQLSPLAGGDRVLNFSRGFSWKRNVVLDLFQQRRAVLFAHFQFAFDLPAFAVIKVRFGFGLGAHVPAAS